MIYKILKYLMAFFILSIVGTVPYFVGPTLIEHLFPFCDKTSPLFTTHDKNDDDDHAGEYNDDEIWCLLVLAFHIW